MFRLSGIARGGYKGHLRALYCGVSLGGIDDGDVSQRDTLRYLNEHYEELSSVQG